MVGEKLTKALEWFDKAVRFEEEKKESLMTKSLDKAIQLEKEGIAAGESWN